MRKPLTLTLAIWAMSASLVAPSFAQAQSAPLRHYTAEYRMYLSGILLSLVELHLSISDKTYRLSAHIAPAGVGHILSDSHVVTTTQGAIDRGRFVPQRLDLSWTADDEIKSSFMDYEAGVPVKFRSGYDLPPEAEPKNKVDFDSVGSGSVDPFLAMLAPIDNNELTSACEGRIRVFDGRRLTTLTAQQPEKIAAHAHEFVAPIPLVACTVIWQPVAGYSERSMARAADLPPIKAHYGRVADLDFAAPLDMRAETKYGNISLYAVRIFEQVPEAPYPFDITEMIDFDMENE